MKQAELIKNVRRQGELFVMVPNGCGGCISVGINKSDLIRTLRIHYADPDCETGFTVSESESGILWFEKDSE